jgi:hypothetical protein
MGRESFTTPASCVSAVLQAATVVPHSLAGEAITDPIDRRRGSAFCDCHMVAACHFDEAQLLTDMAHLLDEVARYLGRNDYVRRPLRN